MLSIDPAVLGFELAASATLGALLGFGTKRVGKTLAAVVGVQLVVFRYLEAKGIVVVRWDRLTVGLVNARDRAGSNINWLETAVSTLSVGAGFTAGFLIGYHRA